MKTMLLIAALTLGGASVANARTPAAGPAVPLCSRTVTDECMNSSQAPKAPHTARHHHAGTKAKAELRHTAASEG